MEQHAEVLIGRPWYQRIPTWRDAVATLLVLAIVILLWQPSGEHVIVLEGLARQATQACIILAILFFIWGVIALRSFDPLGLGSIRAYLRGIKQRPPSFVVRGPYRWMRHPLYFGVLLIIWANPDVTADRLLFDILWTAWICVGAWLEEADLLRDFGDAYERYRRKVPILIPWRGPVKL